MPEHGLHTIAQRIAAISYRPASATARQSAPAGGFDAVLAEQLGMTEPQALQASGLPTATTTSLSQYALGSGLSALPSAVPAGSAGVAARYGTLPPGVRLTGAPSEILPAIAAPGTAAGTGHIGCACHAAAAVEPAGHVHGADHVHSPPALDRSGPPPELQAYGNGRIPPTALEPLGVGEHMLWAPAGRAFQDMTAAAAAEGVTIGVTSSYRTYEKQVELADRLGLYSQGGLAASPGTSNHGWGLSLDLQLDDRAQEWMRENGRNYGFVEDVPREPWHWTFKASSY